MFDLANERYKRNLFQNQSSFLVILRREDIGVSKAVRKSILLQSFRSGPKYSVIRDHPMMDSSDTGVSLLGRYE